MSEILISYARIQEEAKRVAMSHQGRGFEGVYGIPRGGCVPAALVAAEMELPMVSNHQVIGSGGVPYKILIVDDLVDSGETARQFSPMHFDALFRKTSSPKDLAPLASEVDAGTWLVFPWEQETEVGPEQSVIRLLEFIGEDPNREGLRDTPKRVLKALKELTEGSGRDPREDLSTVFEEDHDQMVVLSRIAFSSLCEHHLLPFTGSATVGYIPNGQIVGLSKLARVVETVSRRLQVQERMTDQIADAIDDELSPIGVGVIVTGHHSCMGLRGIRKPEGLMTTSALRGKMLTDGVVRAEFMALHRGA